MHKDWDLEIANGGSIGFKKENFKCNTSTGFLSIAGTRCRHSFSNDFEIQSSYDLIHFPDPRQDRVELDIEVFMDAVRYCVGR